MRTFWTAQSLASEKRESWRQIREKLRNLCSADPSQLKINQTPFLRILCEYNSRLVIDAFSSKEIEDVVDFDGQDRLPDMHTSPPTTDRSSSTYRRGWFKALRLRVFLVPREEIVKAFDVNMDAYITPRTENEGEELNESVESGSEVKLPSTSRKESSRTLIWNKWGRDSDFEDSDLEVEKAIFFGNKDQPHARAGGEGFYNAAVRNSSNADGAKIPLIITKAQTSNCWRSQTRQQTGKTGSRLPI